MTPPRPELSARLAATLGERYELQGEVGSGGMAVVYAARDLRHNRRVAVKLLRPELAATLGDERFLREIELAAGLQHPHILPVYDSGAGHGLLYYVMPFVEGEPLSDRLLREGALPVAEAVRLAREIAGALAFAHERGIIHRDIKPDNILLSAGHALVMDFGIARAGTSPDTRLTATGMAVGTPLYMSPEQGLGAPDVDARTDIYSLGCVLFEMLTGQQPFAGRSLQAILAQSITAPRPRVRKLRPEVPPALEAVVTTALAKEPADRYPTAAAMDAALAAVRPDARGAPVWRTALLAAGAGALLVAAVAWALHTRRGQAEVVAPDARVIAVLPFSAVGEATASGLGEGLVDMLSTNLDGVGGIRTVDPHAVLLGWRKRAGDAGAVDRAGSLALGRTLGAGSVVTGDVVTVGGTVRLSAELTSIGGEVLARARAEGPSEGVLGLVDSLSVRLLRDVWRASSPIPALRVSELTTGSLPAMRAYLEGEAAYRRSDWAAARRAYTQAIEQDSSFALAYLRLESTDEWLGVDEAERRAVLRHLAPRLAHLSPRERGLAIARRLSLEGEDVAAADTALALTVRYPDDLDGWLLLGEMRYHARSSIASSDAEARAPFDRVAALDPSIATVHEHLLDLDAAAADSAAFRADLARLERVTTTDSAAARYRRLATALWGTPAASAAAMRAIPTRRDDPVATTLRVSAPGIPGVAARYLGVLEGISGPAGDSAAMARVELLLALGRFNAASALAATARQRLPTDQTIDHAILLLPALGLDAQPPVVPTLRASVAGFGTRLVARLLAAEVAIVTHDSAAARRTLAEALALDTTGMPARVRPVFEQVAGWERIVRGDSAAGAHHVQVASARTFPGLANVSVHARLASAIALSRAPATRARGMALLRNGFRDDPSTYALRLLALHEAQLAAGDPDAARTAARVTLAWRDAEPAARAAAARLFPNGFPR